MGNRLMTCKSYNQKNLFIHTAIRSITVSCIFFQVIFIRQDFSGKHFLLPGSDKVHYVLVSYPHSTYEWDINIYSESCKMIMQTNFFSKQKQHIVISRSEFRDS